MELLLQLDPVTGYAIPVFVLSFLVEAWVLTRDAQARYPVKDAVASISMGLVSIPINATMKLLAFFAFSWLYPFRLFDLQPWALSTWALLFFADDLAFYTHHRSAHEVRLFWAGHVNHHSSQNYNLAIALRQSWGEWLHKYIWWWWLPLVGFPPLMILVQMAISLVFQFFLHTGTVGRLGVLERVFNTPSHHRVHHASNTRYLDRNHAGILILWDKLFGTFEPEDPKEPVVYGLTSNIHSFNLFTIAFHEYRALWRDVRGASTWRTRLGYVFRPPGWSPDGRTLTANQLRAAEAQRQQPAA